MKIKDINPLNFKETREGFGEGICEIAKTNDKIIALTADLTGSVKLNEFIKAYPKRFLQCGIAEANMIGVAAGLATVGYIPYTTTFANFSTSRVYDQIRQSVAYSQKNVKICASHAGITLGEDGATHQVLEDIGMMKMLPEMTVIVPCDFNQTKLATQLIASYPHPVYLRFGRPKWTNFTNEKWEFEIGKAQVLHKGNDITFFACGHLVWKAIEAAKILDQKGFSVEVINIHTIKPLDEQSIIKSLQKTRCAIVAEEHNILGGLGESISRVAATYLPTPIEFIAVNDVFGQSGTPEQLIKKYGLDTVDILNAAEKLLSQK
ncbi:MAG: transketolase family protein [Chitinophagaceae bacterium]